MKAAKDKGKKKEKVLQWHPAFYAGIQIEFATEADKLIFENEHQLATKPMEIDVLIIKKESNEPLQKNLGRIFRKYNVVEYKSPDDYLGIDDFYKVYGYACFYKADTEASDSIKIDDLTITFVCSKYPRKLMRHLKEERNYSILKVEVGIYYIQGDKFPIQLILTRTLSEEQNLWLKSLTNDLKEVRTAEKLLCEYGKNKNSILYKSMMNIIVRANMEKFEEAKEMCEALEELMKDELDARENKGVQAGLERGMQAGLEKGIQVMKKVLKLSAEGMSMEDIAQELDLSMESVKEMLE